MLPQAPHVPVYWEETQTEPLVSCSSPHLFTPSESITAGETWFHLSTNRLRATPSSQNCTIWIPHLHKMDLIENLVGMFAIKGSFPFVSMEHNLGYYRNLAPGKQLLLLKYVLSILY